LHDTYFYGRSKAKKIVVLYVVYLFAFAQYRYLH